MQHVIAAIVPQRQGHQNDPLLAAHLLATMTAFVSPGLPGAVENLDPNAIDDQDRRGLFEGRCAPSFDLGLDAFGDAIDGLTREHLVHKQREPLLQVAHRQPQDVEVERHVEEMLLGALIAHQKRPWAVFVAPPQLRYAQRVDAAILGVEPALKVARTLLLWRFFSAGQTLIGGKAEFLVEFFDERGFERGFHAEQGALAQGASELGIEFVLEALLPDVVHLGLLLGYRHRVCSFVGWGSMAIAY